MKQILHIFAKDVRRFWPEILVQLALIVALFSVKSYIRTITPQNSSSNLDGSVLIFIAIIALLYGLIPVGWLLLISRVIHEERLVGDTQFWITRPYTWKKLLAAKVLFLTVFIVLTLLLAQSVLLAKDGFSPFAYLPQLLINLLQIAGLVLLPLTALATITSDFARMMLTLLIALLSLGVAIAVWAFAFYGKISNPTSIHIAVFLVMAICCTVVLLQYSRRKAWLSRLLLIAFPVLICVIAWIASDQHLMDRRYPISAAGTGALIQLSGVYDAIGLPMSSSLAGSTNQLGKESLIVRVPFQLSGIEPGRGIIIDGARFILEAPGGFRWSSAWLPLSSTYMPGDTGASADFNLPAAIYQQYKSTPLTLHLNLALSLIQVSKSTTVLLSTQNFTIPDFGICAFNGENKVISCQSAVNKPQLTLISADDAGVRPIGVGPAGAGDYWTGSLDRYDAGATLIPDLRFFVISYRGKDNVGRLLRFLPPGVPVTFTQYTRAGREQASLTLANFHLPAEETPPQNDQSPTGKK